MTDAELVRRFEDSSLSADEFGHAQHVRVAWIYLTRYGRDAAVDRMADGLIRLVTRLGKGDKFQYSLTREWIDRIDAARASHPEAATFESLIAVCPYLLDRTTVRDGSMPDSAPDRS